MFQSLNFYRGLLVGVGMMYVLDPAQGRARRSRIRERVGDALRHSAGFPGIFRERRSSALSHLAGADTLVDRVRAKLGLYVSYPHAVDVDARGGRVTLRGRILRREVEELIGAISSVRGVQEVENRLEPQDQAEGIPSNLPGGGPGFRAGRVSPAAWPMGVQLVAGIVGAAAIVAGATRVAARVRSTIDARDVEEMPEYAMLR